MRSYILWALMLSGVPFYPAIAQRPDTTASRDSLRHQIEERFAARVQADLGLTNEQATKLRATSQQYGVRRREFRTRYQGLRQALSAQLKPGVAANQDSVAKLTDAMIDLRIAAAQSTRDEMREVAKYLTPVQRARFYAMRERLRHRMKEAHEHRGMSGGQKGWKSEKHGMDDVHE